MYWRPKTRFSGARYSLLPLLQVRGWVARGREGSLDAMPLGSGRFFDPASPSGAHTNKEHTMSKSPAGKRFAAIAALAVGALAAGAAHASSAVVGAVVGGGVGAVIGQSIGGRDGAVIGGALGAAAGAAAASDHGYRVHGGAAYPAPVYGPPAVYYPAPPRVVYAPPPPRVVYAPAPRVVYRPVHVAPPPGYVAVRPDYRHWHRRDERRDRYDRHDRGQRRDFRYGPAGYGGY